MWDTNKVKVVRNNMKVLLIIHSVKTLIFKEENGLFAKKINVNFRNKTSKYAPMSDKEYEEINWTDFEHNILIETLRIVKTTLEQYEMAISFLVAWKSIDFEEGESLEKMEEICKKQSDIIADHFSKNKGDKFEEIFKTEGFDFLESKDIIMK